MAGFETIAWATLPPDGDHWPVWGRTHLAETAAPGARTLCGKVVPADPFDWDVGKQSEKCRVCLRVQESRKRA